ncbi:MAG: hypothetical protein ABSA26_08435 [Thermoguttaceae bacterium]|jgi:hypothetical protein
MIHSSLKYWINLLSTKYTQQKIEDVALDIARQCRTILIQRVIGQTKTFSSEQLRGYVRAYAPCPLENILKQRNDVEHLDPTRISKILDQAKEILIEMVIRDMQTMPTKVMADIAAAA